MDHDVRNVGPPDRPRCDRPDGAACVYFIRGRCCFAPRAGETCPLPGPVRLSLVPGDEDYRPATRWPAQAASTNAYPAPTTA